MAEGPPGRGEPGTGPRPLRRMSSLRLETFSDGVFAIAITLLALELRPPDLDGVTTVGGALRALADQRTQFGYYALAFVVVGGLWLEHHQLLDRMETHGRLLARTNLLFLLTVSLLPYWVSVLEAHHDSGAAGGLLLLDMALARVTFVLVCLGVRADLGGGDATAELVTPVLLQSAAAAAVLLVIAGVVTSGPPHAGAVVGGLLGAYVLVTRLAVRGWRVRHRRRLAGGA